MHITRSRIFAPLFTFLLSCSFIPTGGTCLLGGCGGSVPAGFDDDTPDEVDGDLGDAPDASPDALTCPPDQIATPDGCQPRPHIECKPIETDGNGNRRRPIEITGWSTHGLLGGAPAGAMPMAVMYGSNFDAQGIMASCNGFVGDLSERWVVPYPAPCSAKPQISWMGEGTNVVTVLKLFEDANEFNLAVLYDDGTVRWADIRLDDGDPDGFTVGGPCHVEHPGGNGGLILTTP